LRKKKVPSYPFPSRNAAYPHIEDIIFVAGKPLDSDQYAAMHLRANAGEARFLRYQYVSIEQDLERAYAAVCPCEQNAQTFSFRFAEIIRFAAGVFETWCKTLYSRFYEFDKSRQRLDIYNRNDILDKPSRIFRPYFTFPDFPARRVEGRPGVLPSRPRIMTPAAGHEKPSPCGEGKVGGKWGSCSRTGRMVCPASYR
jgi:hypothetical protein